MNQSEEIAYNWLKKRYNEKDIVFSSSGFPDFTTSDGEGWEVKRMMAKNILFYPNQRDRLENVKVIIVKEDEIFKIIDGAKIPKTDGLIEDIWVHWAPPRPRTPSMKDVENVFRTVKKNEKITICGVGALGGNLAENLSRQGYHLLRIIDDDKVEERNIATQPYYREDIGNYKVKILAERLYRCCSARVEMHRLRLDASKANILLKDCNLVVDCFDNPPSREIVKSTCALLKTPCLHMGLAEGYAEIVWSERYRIPQQTGRNPCDNPEARDTILIAVATATSGAIIPFFKSGERNSYSITMKDLRIQRI